jgi:hypothetical protein
MSRRASRRWQCQKSVHGGNRCHIAFQLFIEIERQYVSISSLASFTIIIACSRASIYIYTDTDLISVRG